MTMSNIAEKRSLNPGFRQLLHNAGKELVDGVQALEVLSTMTEEEFLYVGSKLKDFHDRAAKMAELSKSATGLVSGDEIRRTMDGLRDLVEGVSAGLKNSESMAAVSLTKLRHIVDLIEEVYISLDDLERITRTLNMLGLSMIIQNATLTRPVRSLQVLGEDVRRLSAAIDQKASQIAAETKGAAESITNILSDLSSLQVAQQTKVAGILRKTQAGISSLSEKYDLSAGITLDISEISAEISRSIGNIVTSAQVHDITRQQFEGLAVAFRGILSTLTGSGEDDAWSDEAEARRLVDETVDFCDEQGSSLLHAKDHFVFAAREIIRNLKLLTRTVRAIRARTLEVMNTGSSNGDSFLLLIENDLDSVRSALAALSETVQIGNEISQAILVVARTTGRLSGFTDDVENIGDQIELIALNAEVKAEGLGQGGRGLAVIAESVQKISVEAQDCIRSISLLLRSITSSSDELSDAVVSTGETVVPREKKMSKGLRDFIDSLRSVNGKVFSVLSECEEFGLNLSTDIEEVSRAISVHESVDKVAGEILANLWKTASAGRKVMGGDSGKRSYFQGKAGNAEDLQSVEKDRLASCGPYEFGSNVELF